jgi:hypothetical protein
MLHVIVCHVNHVSSEKFELASGLAETMPTRCEKRSLLRWVKQQAS